MATCAEQLVEIAKTLNTPQEIFIAAIGLSGCFSDTGDENFDPFYFQDDGSAAALNRRTLEVEILG